VRKSAAPAAPAIEGEALETLWQQIVDAAGMASPFVKTYLLEAHPVAFEKNVLTIGFDPEFADHLALVDNPRNHQLLQTKLAEAGHSRTLVKFIEAPAPPGRARSAAPASGPEAAPSPARKDDEPARKSKPAGSVDMEEFKNDPLIKKALEIFKGQIVDVRA
jgi:hypothetical protein